MEELLRSLRNLELAEPHGEQIVALVDPDPRVEKQLAQQLAVPARIELHEDDASALMDAALMSGATEAMLDNYNAALKKESDMLQKEFENRKKPSRVKPVPLKALLAAQEAAIRRRHAEREAGSTHDGHVYVPRQIMDTEHTYASEKSVSALSRMDMDELMAPKRYEHKYLLVQVASRLALYASCCFIGVTPQGGAIPVSIAHFTPNLHLYGDELDALLPIGSVLLIREPYVSQHYMGIGGPVTGGKGMVGVRVDTPADVHVLDAREPILQGVEWKHKVPVMEEHAVSNVVWRQEGPLTRAWQLHIEPIDMSRESVHATVRTLLQQERPGAAWREICAAELFGIWSAGKKDEAAAKTHDVLALVHDTLLKAEVLFSLQLYDRVCECLDKCAGMSLSELEQAAVTDRRNAAQLALEVGRKGPSDTQLYDMFLRTLQDPTPRYDYAEYVGPVCVADIPGAGRGLVLTRDVEEGELLLFCRAMGSSYAKDAACLGMPLLRCNPDTGVTSTTTQVLAATRCMHAMMDRPELALPFLGLTAGPDTPYSHYVLEPYPLQTRAMYEVKDALHMVSPLSSATPLCVSSHYVNNVLRFNAFGPAAVPAAEAGNDPMSRSTMPHPLPAILNHACLPNVSSVFFGDFVTTRALHPLPKGTQIMHQYVQGEVPYDARQAQLAKHGFVCTCGLCELDAADGAERRKRRDEILARDWPPLQDRSRALLKGDTHGHAAAAEAHKDMAESLISIADALAQTYAPTRGKLQPDMVDVWHRAAMHVRVYDRQKAMGLAHLSLAATGAVPCADGPHQRISHLPQLHLDGAVRSMLMLAGLHWDTNAPDSRQQALGWIESAVHSHTCMIGGGRALFLQRWGGDRAEGEYQKPLHAWLSTNAS